MPRLRRGCQLAERDWDHGDVTGVAAGSLQRVSADDQATTNGRAKKQVEKIVMAAAMAVKKLGDGCRGSVVLAENRQFGLPPERSREVEVVPLPEIGFRQSKLMQPGTEIEGLSKANPGDVLTLLVREFLLQGTKVLAKDPKRVFGGGQDGLMGLTAEDIAGKINQQGFKSCPVDPYAEGECSAGCQFQDRGWLPPAPVVTFARFLDQTVFDEVLDDGPNSRIRQLDRPREFRFGRFPGPPKDLQHNALVVAAKLRGVRPAPPLRRLVQRLLPNRRSDIREGPFYI